MLSHHWTEMLDDFVVTTSRSGWREVSRHRVNVPWFAGHDTGGKKSSSGQQRWGKHGVATSQWAHGSHTPRKMTSPVPSDPCANSIIASCMNFSHQEALIRILKWCACSCAIRRCPQDIPRGTARCLVSSVGGDWLWRSSTRLVVAY